MRTERQFWDCIRVGSESECWPWTGGLDSRGYGHLNWQGQPNRAHRVAYRIACGEIPEGEGYHGTVVRHGCDFKLCCNPAHLSLGSHADNMADMRARGRRKEIGAGEENGRAILSAADVEAIRRDPRGTRMIAKDYPVSRSAIQRIKTGKAWAGLSLG